MRARVLFVAIAVVLTVARFAPASIQIQAGDYIRMSDGPGGLGGVFNVQETNSTTTTFFGDMFPTFCVETTEHISLPGTYYVQGLGSKATQTGNVLTDLAGWIYVRFLDGQLPHQPGLLPADVVKFNNSVQVSLWMEVLNNNMTNPPAVPWTASALANQYISGGLGNIDTSWVSDFLDISYSGSNHGVQIMNLRTSGAANADDVQDQLVRNTHAPEATSLVVWMMLVSCGLLLSYRGRFKRSACK